MKKIKGNSALRKSLYKNNRGNFALALIALLLSCVTDIGMAYVLKVVLDIAMAGTLSDIPRMIYSCLVLMVASGGTYFLLRIFRNRFVHKASANYKEAAFKRILNKNINAFSKETTGKYVSNLTNDVSTIETGYLHGTILLLNNILLFCMSLVYMFYLSWQLTLWAVGVSLLPMFINVLLGGKLTALEKKVSEKNEGFVSMVKDLLSGFSVIKSFKAESRIERLFNLRNTDLEKTKKKRRDMNSDISILSMVAGLLVWFVVFGIGAYYSITGLIAVSVIVACIQLVNNIINPIVQITPQLAERKAAIALMDKLSEATEPSETDEIQKRTILDIGEGIRFKNVSFAYDADMPVLKNINVNFDSGKSYAIVGMSGSGKSTLLNMMLGYFEDYDGDIAVDGAELREIDTVSLYDTFSIIQQSVFIFDDTILNNITMYGDYSESAMQDAMDKSGLNELVLEKGSDAICGENGCNLSGGEKQRIAIARCLLRKTPVMLMDEATAALDNTTAHMVENALLNIDDITRIVVTHKMDSAIMKRYDEIVVLRDGMMVEQGSFDALIAYGGYFASLYNVAH